MMGGGGGGWMWLWFVLRDQLVIGDLQLVAHQPVDAQRPVPRVQLWRAQRGVDPVE